jgi:hypothetical protein
MDEASVFVDPHSLRSGLWRGYYQQAEGRYPQQQTMEFADGMVRGEGGDALGAFRIEGRYRNDHGAFRIGWIKTYDGGHSVLYLGGLDAAGIRGHWELEGGHGDRFALAFDDTRGGVRT